MVVETEVFDRRAALEEAFDSAEADAKGEEYVPPVREKVEPESTASDSVDQRVEKDPAVVEQAAADKSVAKDRPRTKGVPPAQRVAPTDKGVEPAVDGEKTGLDQPKAPIGWGVQRDALWAKVPADVRQVIAKRELEIQRGMSRAGNIEKVATEYMDVVKPFENVIRGMNTTPRDAISNVMKTATALITGPQNVKAAVLVEMIQNYGVDLPTLDAALSEALKNPRQPINQNVAPQMDPRMMQHFQPLFALQQKLEQQELQKTETLQTEAAAAISTIADKPHYEDLREDMADIMELAAKRGVVVTINQAYDKAAQLHPEISKIFVQKKKANEVSAAASTLARSRRAASTVSGAPSASALKGGATDRRSQLEAAWNDAT